MTDVKDSNNKLPIFSLAKNNLFRDKYLRGSYRYKGILEYSNIIKK